MFATRAYALLFVLVLSMAAAVEFVPRGAPSRLHTRELAKRIQSHESTAASIAERVGRGDMTPDDAETLDALRDALPELRREAAIRKVRTGGFVVLAIASVLFALVTAPRVLFSKRPPPRAGDVEIVPDEEVEIDPVEGAHEVGKLHPTRDAAIAMLLDQVSLHCSYCNTLWRPEVLGRIGKRILLRRAPPGASEVRSVLGEGWWSRPANPPPCVTCGSNDLVPD